MHKLNFRLARLIGILWANSKETPDMHTQTIERADLARPLAGKVAIVTGSTSGIGLGIARALAHAGADVVINGLGEQQGNRVRLRGARERLPVQPGRYNGANLMDGIEATKLVEETIAEFGRVDILVNNAGIQHVSPIEDFPAGEV